MMEGPERALLERAVWGFEGGDGEVGIGESDESFSDRGLECVVRPGDALFIPKGFWHSIKGVGQGITGSVNWWFR